MSILQFRILGIVAIIAIVSFICYAGASFP
jgi:hypothetical protein